MLHVRLLYPLLQLIRSKAEVLPSMTDLESRIWSWLNECIRIWLAEGYCIFKHVPGMMHTALLPARNLKIHQLELRLSSR